MLLRVAWYIMTDVSWVLTASTYHQSTITIILMMVAVSSSEKSVSIYYTTWCNIPEDGHLQDGKTMSGNLRKDS
jgi:hypothetical protein